MAWGGIKFDGEWVTDEQMPLRQSPWSQANVIETNPLMSMFNHLQVQSGVTLFQWTIMHACRELRGEIVLEHYFTTIVLNTIGKLSLN